MHRRLWERMRSGKTLPVVHVEGLQLSKVPVEGRDVLGPYTPECANLENITCLATEK